MQMRTRSQSDAIKALEHVEGIRDRNDPELSQRYSTLVNRFPIMVRQNGLQQALGFLAGKSAGDPETAECIFLNHIAEIFGIPVDDLIKTVLKTQLNKYMFYTRRSLEVANWYRRFTEGVLGIDVTGAGIQSEREENHDN